MKQEETWAFFKNEILEVWRSNRPSNRPGTFWFAEHDTHPSSAFDIDIDIPVVRCCYFDGRTFRDRESSSYFAFMRVSGIPPGGTGLFEIGYGGIARLEDSNDFLFGWQFGGLFGRGLRYDQNDGGFAAYDLWVS